MVGKQIKSKKNQNGETSIQHKIMYKRTKQYAPIEKQSTFEVIMQPLPLKVSYLLLVLVNYMLLCIH